MVEGPDAGLQALEPLRNEPALRHYYLLPAARADMLRRLGRGSEAADSYRQALEERCTEPERRFLSKRLNALKGDEVS
jgi:RNA polymerase sigma-70 factor (ECF subfamily)